MHFWSFVCYAKFRVISCWDCDYFICFAPIRIADKSNRDEFGVILDSIVDILSRAWFGLLHFELSFDLKCDLLKRVWSSFGRYNLRFFSINFYFIVTYKKMMNFCLFIASIEFTTSFESVSSISIRAFKFTSQTRVWIKVIHVECRQSRSRVAHK